MSASAFSTTLTLPSAGFAVSKGEAVVGGLHDPKLRHHHCGHCLSWVFTRTPRDLVNLRATMLDEAGWFVPSIEVQTAEKLPWVTTPAAHSYERFPPFEEWQRLSEEYATRGARPSGARILPRPAPS